MSKMTLVLAAGAVMTMSSLVPVTASASTGITARRVVSSAEAPPVCVTATYKNPKGPYQNVYVTNSCPVSQRVKVLWAHATDSGCHTIAAGATYEDHHLNQNFIDRWDGIASC